MLFQNKENTSKIKICRVTRRVGQYTLLWPNDDEELNPGIRYKLKLVGFVLITGVMSVLNTTHLYFTIKNPNEEVNIEEIATIISGYGIYYMICAYTLNQRSLAILFRDFSNFKQFGVPPGFEKRNKQLDFCCKILVYYSFLGVAIYTYVKFSEKKQCLKHHAERQTNGNFCGLLTSLWIPFNIDYFPVFQLIDIYEAIAAHMLIKWGAHLSFNAFEIVHHIILRIKHLRKMIIKCFQIETYEKTRAELNKCVDYHSEILSLTKRVDDIFFYCMFGHFALTGTICALVEIQILSGTNVLAGVAHIILWIGALFLACVGGQHLLDASEIIPQAIWTSKWYQADIRLRKDLLFMLVRSQKTICLRTGPFGILCFPLFLSVLKALFSIMCFLTSQ